MVVVRSSGPQYLGFGAAIVFFISPILSLPFILYGIYLQKKSAYFLFACLLGVFAWLQIPLGDLWRHTFIIEEYASKDITHIFARKDSDFIIYTLGWLARRMGISYQIVRLVTICESFFILCLILHYMLNNSQRKYTQSEAFQRFVILFLFYEFIQTVSGTRYGVASYNYIFALHLWFNKRNYKLALLFGCIAAFTHESFLYFVPISVFAILVCRSRPMAIAIMVTAFIIVLPFINYFAEYIGRRSEFYFGSGKDMSVAEAGTTIIGFLLFYCCRLLNIPFICLAIKYFKQEFLWARASLVWIAFLFATITNLLLLFRFAFIIQIIGVFMLIQIESKYRLSKRTINCVLLCGILLTSMNILNYRTYIIQSRYQYAIAPLPIVLCYEYKLPWISEHVNGNSVIKDTYSE